MDNLIRIKKTRIKGNTKAGIVNTLKLDVPIGYVLESCICLGGVATYDINTSDYSTTPTNLSYTFDSDGNVFFSITHDPLSSDRYIYIIGFLLKK